MSISASLTKSKSAALSKDIPGSSLKKIGSEMSKSPVKSSASKMGGGSIRGKSKLSALAKTVGEPVTKSSKKETPVKVAGSGNAKSSAKESPASKVPATSVKLPATTMTALKSSSELPSSKVQPTITYAELKKIKKQPYEKVKPKPGKKRLKEWWSSNTRRQRRSFMIKVIVAIGIAFLLAVILTVLGVIYLWQERHERRAPKGDPRLRQSMTTMCREAYPHLDPDCIYEDERVFDECRIGFPYCGHLRWNLTHVKTTTEAYWRFMRDDEFLPLYVTEHAECGYMKWCHNESCVKADLDSKDWWPRNSYDEHGTSPFKDSESRLTAGREVVEKSLKCLRLSPEGQSMYDRVVVQMDMTNRCDPDICAAGVVESAARIAFDSCELSQDPVTGIRTRPCGKDHQPMYLIRCLKCLEYEQAAELKERSRWCNDSGLELVRREKCYYACRDPNTTAIGSSYVRHGLSCKDEKHVCFGGNCYATIDETQTEKEDE